MQICELQSQKIKFNGFQFLTTVPSDAEIHSLRTTHTLLTYTNNIYFTDHIFYKEADLFINFTSYLDQI